MSRLTRQDDNINVAVKKTSLRRESEERGNNGRRGTEGSSRGGGGRSRRVSSKGRDASAANSVERRPGSMERGGELRGGQQRLTRQLSSSQDSLLPRRERRSQFLHTQIFCEE